VILVAAFLSFSIKRAVVRKNAPPSIQMKGVTYRAYCKVWNCTGALSDGALKFFAKASDIC